MSFPRQKVISYFWKAVKLTGLSALSATSAELLGTLICYGTENALGGMAGSVVGVSIVAPTVTLVGLATLLYNNRRQPAEEKEEKEQSLREALSPQGNGLCIWSIWSLTVIIHNLVMNAVGNASYSATNLSQNQIALSNFIGSSSLITLMVGHELLTDLIERCGCRQRMANLSRRKTPPDLVIEAMELTPTGEAPSSAGTYFSAPGQ